MFVCTDSDYNLILFAHSFLLIETRPDTRLPQSRVGGQGPQFRSVEHLGRSKKAKTPINAEKVKWTDGWRDRRTDGWTDGQTDGRTG